MLLLLRSLWERQPGAVDSVVVALTTVQPTFRLQATPAALVTTLTVPALSVTLVVRPEPAAVAITVAPLPVATIVAVVAVAITLVVPNVAVFRIGSQGPWRRLDGGIAEKRRRLANEDNDDLALYDLGVIGKFDA